MTEGREEDEPILFDARLTLSHGRVNKPTVCSSFTELLQLLGDMFVIGIPWKLCGLPQASATPKATAFSRRAVEPSAPSFW